MTIADLAMWRLLGWINGGALDGLPKDTLDSFPQLQANYLATGNNEKIKAWMAEKYPNTSNKCGRTLARARAITISLFRKE